jgi:hypothetical protein
MPERADKHQKPQTEISKNQPDKIAAEVKSLKVNTDQTADTTHPEIPPSSSFDSNSLPTLHAHRGNQQVQRLLNSPASQIHRSTIHDLQTRIGNKGVQRLLLKNAASTNFISRKSHLIQRRVPESADIDNEALETSSKEDNEVNRKGLQVVLRRVIADMDKPVSEPLMAEVNKKNKLDDTIESGTTKQLLELVQLIETKKLTGTGNRSLVLKDTESYAVPLSKNSNYPKIKSTVEKVSQLLTEIGSGSTHDQHLKDVFGKDKQYGWDKAKGRFVKAGEELLRALEREHIMSDQTGSSEEMNAGGMTLAGEQLVVGNATMNNPDTPQAFRVFSHEAFHYAFADIRDGGGYSDSNKGFPIASATAKFHNADHYGEVCLRATGAGSPGVVYKPGTQPKSGNATQASAEDMFRQAWSLALNIFSSLREHYNRQFPRPRPVSQDELKTLVHHSILFELTYHQRKRGESATLINQIDLALAEGVVRRLDEALTVINNISATEAKTLKGADAYIKFGLQKVSGITSSLERDVQMVKYVVSKGDAILDIQELPKLK